MKNFIQLMKSVQSGLLVPTSYATIFSQYMSRCSAYYSELLNAIAQIDYDKSLSEITAEAAKYHTQYLLTPSGDLLPVDQIIIQNKLYVEEKLNFSDACISSIVNGRKVFTYEEMSNQVEGAVRSVQELEMASIALESLGSNVQDTISRFSSSISESWKESELFPKLSRILRDSVMTVGEKTSHILKVISQGITMHASEGTDTVNINFTIDPELFSGSYGICYMLGSWIENIDWNNTVWAIYQFIEGVCTTIIDTISAIINGAVNLSWSVIKWIFGPVIDPSIFSFNKRGDGFMSIPCDNFAIDLNTCGDTAYNKRMIRWTRNVEASGVEPDSFICATIDDLFRYACGSSFKTVCYDCFEDNSIYSIPSCGAITFIIRQGDTLNVQTWVKFNQSLKLDYITLKSSDSSGLNGLSGLTFEQVLLNTISSIEEYAPDSATEKKDVINSLMAAMAIHNNYLTLIRLCLRSLPSDIDCTELPNTFFTYFGEDNSKYDASFSFMISNYLLSTRWYQIGRSSTATEKYSKTASWTNADVLNLLVPSGYDVLRNPNAEDLIDVILYAIISSFPKYLNYYRANCIQDWDGTPVLMSGGHFPKPSVYLLTNDEVNAGIKNHVRNVTIATSVVAGLAFVSFKLFPTVLRNMKVLNGTAAALNMAIGNAMLNGEDTTSLLKLQARNKRKIWLNKVCGGWLFAGAAAAASTASSGGSAGDNTSAGIAEIKALIAG